MRKVQPEAVGRKARGPREGAQDALENVVRLLARELPGGPSERLKAALQALADAIHDDEPDDDTRAAKGRRAREDDGLATDNETAISKRRGRHDQKRASGGRDYRHGELSYFPIQGVKLEAMSPMMNRDRAMLDSLITSMGAWRRVDVVGVPRSLLDNERQRLEAAFEAFFGRPYGQPDWIGFLLSVLEFHEHRREEIRLREAHGDPDPAKPWELLPDPELEPEDGAGFVRMAAAMGIDLPKELTAEVYDILIERVGFGGRGKKKAKNVVADFVAGLEKKRKAGLAET